MTKLKKKKSTKPCTRKTSHDHLAKGTNSLGDGDKDTDEDPHTTKIWHDVDRLGNEKSNNYKSQGSENTTMSGTDTGVAKVGRVAASKGISVVANKKTAAVPGPYGAPSVLSATVKYTTAPAYDGDFSNNCKAVTLDSLILNADPEDPEFSDDDKSYQKEPTPFLFLLLLGVTKPKQDVSQLRYTSYRGNKKGKSIANYKVKYTFASLNDAIPRTCVVLETTNDTHNLFWYWDKAHTAVSVGVRIAVQTPRVMGFLPTKSVIITTDQPFLLLTAPAIPLKALSANNSTHEMRYFVLKGQKIAYDKNHMPVVWKTSCNADVCDRLQFQHSTTVSCGCFGQNSKNDSSARNCILKFDIWFKDSAGQKVGVENFTSLRTSRVFFKNEVVVGDYETLSAAGNKEILHRKFACAVKHINKAGGWTIVGWFIRGEIDDDAKEDAESNALSDKLQYHISYLYPTTLKVEALPSKCVFQASDLLVRTTNAPAAAPAIVGAANL